MTRTPTPIDAIANEYTAESAGLDPIMATQVGIAGHDHLLTDFSPAGHEARASLDRATLDALSRAKPQDEQDEVTLAAMRDILGLNLELFEAGEPYADLNVIASPLQNVRDVFDLMATDTVDDWATIAARLAQVPDAIAGYLDSLRLSRDVGLVPAALQVDEAISQASEFGDPATSFFVEFARSARVRREPGSPSVRPGTGSSAEPDAPPAPDVRLPDALAADLTRAAAAAAQAYATLADFLADSLAPSAPERDAVGRDRYARWSRHFVGARVDLDETYAWGLDELARLTAEQEAIAAQIAGPGASVEAAMAELDQDPSRKLHGTDALREWMQATADAAVAALDQTYFDIPEPVRRLEAMIAPTHSGGIYYTGPSDDFSRPGRMWWSVPAGVEDFATWREKTTVYHEGVPGHHLQIGQAVCERDRLNDWRRLACWTSGYGEGWALYAERLMAEFGFMDDPADRLGLVDGQRMRAARVVIDIGVHCGLPAPARWGGGTWDKAKAWELLKANVHENEPSLRFELNRYLGWPGQAPSYKIGQRLWEQLRADVARREGAAFDLKAFHTRALKLGSLPLDVLRTALG